MKVRVKKSKELQPKSAFPWSFLAISMLVGFKAYFNTIENGYVLDDISAITENTLVRKGTDAIFNEEKNIWNTDYRYGYWNEPGSLYRPLALSLFAWEWGHWENNPKPAHIINVLLFTLICGLLFYWLFLLFNEQNKWLPLFIALLFALHPIHTEVTANIKSADELLAVFFSLIMFIAILKNGVRWISLWMLLALVCYFLALTSKESVLTLLPVAPLMLWFFKTDNWKETIWPGVVMLVPIGLYFIIRKNVLGAVGGTETFQMIDNIVAEMSAMERFPTAVKICGLYLWKLFIPQVLSHDYSFNEIEVVGFGSIYFWISLIVYGTLIWVAIKGLKSKSMLSFSILFFLLSFSLYSNIVFVIGTHFGERLLFLPSIGFSMAIGWLFWKWSTLKTIKFEIKNSALPMFALALVLVLYGMKTIARNREWKSEVSLYEADILNAPKSTRTHYRLGRAYMMEKAVVADEEKEKNMWLRKAVAELMRSVEIYPEYADAQGELGLAYQRLGMKDQAVEHYRIALKYNPNHATTLNNMGTVLFEQGKFDRAIDHFQRALVKNPRYKDAMGNLASCYGTIGEYNQAIKWFKEAIKFDPKNANYYYYVGVTYQNKKDLVEAEAWLNKAYRINPSLKPK